MLYCIWVFVVNASPRIELLAQDRLNMRIADNSGRRVQNRILSGTGHLQTPVPVKKWKVSTWDSDVELSQDARTIHLQ